MVNQVDKTKYFLVEEQKSQSHLREKSKIPIWRESLPTKIWVAQLEDQ